MEYASDLIPDISPELISISDALQDQLRRMEEFLAQRNHFIFHQTARQCKRVVKKFVGILQQYVKVTLKDLFSFINNVSDLTRIYNQDYEAFLLVSASTIQKVESCIKEVDAMVDQHDQTLQDLGETGSEMTDLIKKYEKNANSHSSGAVRAQLVSTGLAITGIAAGAGFAAVATPLAGVGALCLVSAGGGGISRMISKYDEHKSRIYTTASIKLGEVQEYNNEFRAPIQTIYVKLLHNKRFLGNLQQDTTNATTIANPEDDRDRQAAYRSAKVQAQNINDVCLQILGYAGRIAILKGQLTHRTRQIAAP